MDLSFNTRVKGRYAVVEAVGDIDAYTAAALRAHFLAVVNSGAHDLILDLDKVEFMDSTGLGVLVGALKRVRALDGSLSLVCTRENIVKIFRITGLNTVFAFHADVDQAVEAVDALV